MIKGILFDFFGTLVEYSASRVEQGHTSTHKLLLDSGVDISYSAFLTNQVAVSGELDQWSRRSGREYFMEQVAIKFLTRVCPHGWSGALPGQLWMSYINEWGVAICYMPGVPELMEDLSSRFRLGVVTNTHFAPLIHTHLREIGIAQYMGDVVTSIEHGRPKPHLSIFASASAHLRCPAESTLFVGDFYEADYFGARGAGMQACLIDPFGAANVRAHEVIRSVLDVKTHVEQAA